MRICCVIAVLRMRIQRGATLSNEMKGLKCSGMGIEYDSFEQIHLVLVKWKASASLQPQLKRYQTQYSVYEPEAYGLCGLCFYNNVLFTYIT